jgi:ABC-type Fe3+ transport system permease subunit
MYMKRIKYIFVSLVATVMVACSLAPVALAVNPIDSVQSGVDASGGASSKGDKSLKASIKKIVDVLLFVVGAVAVIVIVVGGIRYVVSAGDSNQITAAKNTILYAVIGLIVAILAYAIVNWVLAVF